jgi:DNA polymerase III epsilon subunit-like protein
MTKQLGLYGHKLVDVCRHFGISIDAHDALSDIRATRDLVQVLKNGLKLDLWDSSQDKNG